VPIGIREWFGSFLVIGASGFNGSSGIADDRPSCHQSYYSKNWNAHGDKNDLRLFAGRCKATLGTRVGAHVELFAANRVVLIASGIGTRPPVSYSAGRIAKAHCYGDLVTLEPTGVVLVRRGVRLTLSDLFRSWGQPLSERRLASFSADPGRGVQVYVDGRPRSGAPGEVPLTPHSEIVLEVGPHVPPHSAYTFPPGS
jgi:hypothetical protein